MSFACSGISETKNDRICNPQVKLNLCCKISIRYMLVVDYSNYVFCELVRLVRLKVKSFTSLLKIYVSTYSNSYWEKIVDLLE